MWLVGQIEFKQLYPICFKVQVWNTDFKFIYTFMLGWVVQKSLIWMAGDAVIM